MKKILILAIPIILIITGVVLFTKLPDSQDTDQSEQTNSQTNQADQSSLDFDIIQTEIGNNEAKLYDVRTPGEFSDGHFENAINLSLQDMQNGKLPDESKTEKIYVYCRSGNRSSQAKTLLQKAGYTNIVDLGGLPNIQKIGGKLVTN